MTPRWTFTRRVAVAFWLAFTALAVLQSITYYEATNREDFDARQERSQEILLALKTVLSDVLDAQAGASGFLSTGSPAYRDQYDRASGAATRHLDDLARLLADSRPPAADDGRRPASHPTGLPVRAEDLAGLAPAALDEMGRAIRARQEGIQLPAPAIADLERERERVERLRDLISKAEQDEQDNLARHTAAERASVRHSAATFAAVTGLDLFLGGVGLWALGRFVAQRRRAEASLAAARESAEEARANAESAHAAAVTANLAKDRVLATVSHDLRTPLSSILLWAQLLKTRAASSDPEVGEAADAIAESVRAQTRLVDDLLDASRLSQATLRLEIGDVDVAAVVHSARDAVAPTADARGVRLTASISPPAPGAPATIRGDAFRLRQVLWNLLSNAVKFTPAGGRVELTLRSEPERVRLAVRDTGAGIPADFLPHVFEAFRQGEPSSSRARGQGIGLGLAIVKHVVELHGGRVEAHSDGPGRGSTFVVTLPTAGAPG